MLRNSFFNIQNMVSGCDGLEVMIRINPEHEIFRAHFPGQPIMPGVCQIQIVTEILSLHIGRAVYLTDIKNVKYMSVISPIEVVEMTVRFQKLVMTDGSCRVIVLYEGGGRIFSKMSMMYEVVRDNPDIQ